MHVELKQKGKDYWGLCPFHDEKTPSFSVSPDKRMYYCFGCRASGTALDFLMAYERKSFPEAVEQLAASVNMEVPRTKGEIARQHANQSLYQALAAAAEYFAAQLRDHPGANAARSYLHHRGISEQICARFCLGYAPPANHLLSTMRNRFPVATLVEAGLVAARDGGHQDRFRNRIIFPIRDRQGRPIAFGGRIIAARDHPKYLNSPETPLFQKKRQLYGLHEARQAGRAIRQLVFVEGYMDVLALADAGIEGCVACLGTALSSEHLELGFRTVPKILFCFDGDQAGRKAARRSLTLLPPLLDDEHQAHFLLLPEEEDPDSLVHQQGADAFRDKLRTALPFSKYLLRCLGEEYDTDSLEGRAGLAREASGLVRAIKGPLFRRLVGKEVALRVGLDEDALDLDWRNDWEQGFVPPENRARISTQNAQAKPAPTEMVSLGAQLLRAILEAPSLCEELGEENLAELREAQNENARLLYDLVVSWRAKPTNNTALLVARFGEDPRYERLMELQKKAAELDQQGIDWQAQFHDVWPRLQAQLRREARRLQKRRSDRPTDAQNE